MKIAKTLLASALYLIVLVLIYYIHVNYFKVDVVFYSAITDAIIATAVAGGALLFFTSFKVFNLFEKFQLIVIWLITGYALAISLPTVIDRSLSFYILEKIQQRGGGIRQEAFEHIFTHEYLIEHRLVDVRLTEQLASKTITIEAGCVVLTPKGQSIAEFSRNFRQHWLPKYRLLLGKYSDALIDPFRNSQKASDYKCGDK